MGLKFKGPLLKKFILKQKNKLEVKKFGQNLRCASHTEGWYQIYLKWCGEKGKKYERKNKVFWK